jgi:hypothetical protein
LWSYENWDSWAPDNYYPTDNYLHVDTNNNRWNDQVEDSNYPAILEWDSDCNSDGIVDYGQCRDGLLPDYNGNNIPDCCERGDTCVVGNYPVQWRVAHGGNGHWYTRMLDTTSWFSSKEKCTQVGGHLATITSAPENDFIHGILGANQAWIGGMQTPGSCEPGCGWSWITGEPWTYSNWSPGEPNNDLQQDFLQIYPTGAWDDFWNSGPFQSVCEWTADCNSDGIVDYGQILTGQLVDANTNGIPDVCEQPTCVDADLFRDFNVNGADLGILLSQWGPNTELTVSDINEDGFVNGADLGILLSFWGACP